MDRIGRPAALVAAALLLLALAPWPYDYYRLLRVVVFGVGVWAGMALLGRERPTAVALFIAAALFNPFVPAHLTREIWSILNIAGAALFVRSAYVLKPLNPPQQR